VNVRENSGAGGSVDRVMAGVRADLGVSERLCARIECVRTFHAGGSVDWEMESRVPLWRTPATLSGYM
jgi:hypothetical protein